MTTNAVVTEFKLNSGTHSLKFLFAPFNFQTNFRKEERVLLVCFRERRSSPCGFSTSGESFGGGCDRRPVVEIQFSNSNHALVYSTGPRRQAANRRIQECVVVRGEDDGVKGPEEKKNSKN